MTPPFSSILLATQTTCISLTLFSFSKVLFSIPNNTLHDRVCHGSGDDPGGGLVGVIRVVPVVIVVVSVAVVVVVVPAVVAEGYAAKQ